MADKALTESAWKALVKGKAVTQDADVLKALGLLARVEKPKPDAAGLIAQRDALGGIEKALAAFSKVNLKALREDKVLTKGVSELTTALERHRKSLETLAKELEREAKSSEDDDEDAPDILTTRMVPLIRQVKAGVEAHTKLALSGKEVVVMLSRKPISPARRTLLVEQLEQKGSVKIIDGTCILENKFVTFVLNNPASGLAKKISAALYKQTNQRVPVRVRGPDGDVDEEGEEEQAQEEGAKGQDVKGKTEAPVTKSGTTVDKGRFVNHAKSRLAWEKVRQKLQADLKALEAAILGYCKGKPDLAGPATAKVRKLDTILVALDESLIDILDKALNAQTDQKRLDLHEASRAVLARYINFVKSDSLLAGIDQNPFVPLKTREFLLTSLQALDKSLA
ncbi:MAG TPA: hypothetical protein H9903_07325 [Candidatus Aquabacterium excrementipullorum]|nr:hypothetical protein [Candidatus Aquabacterium excrementipullorum]